MLNLGTLLVKPGWFNAGYIFPKNYSANIQYRDISAPEIKVLYNCQIIDGKGKPLFKVTSPTLNKTFSGKSPTACWKQILDCINSTLKSKRFPVVKTQVAGPEYFGLNDPFIVEEIEKLDPNKKCEVYWKEKENILAARELYEANQPRAEKKPKKKRKTEDEDLDLTCEATFREDYVGTWSSINRKERLVNRLEKLGKDPMVEDDNPIPHHMDPITLQPVVVPAVSPYGHVAGYYSWTKALKESGQCPFTKQPLTIERITKLTKLNYHLFKDYLDLSFN